MPYNEKLTERVREILGKSRHIQEKKMMGGLTFMVNGKMCVGILGDELMCRIDPGDTTALKKKGARPMDFTGKPMKGFVFVNKKGTSTKKDLSYWVGLSLKFNKKAKASKKRSKS